MPGWVHHFERALGTLLSSFRVFCFVLLLVCAAGWPCSLFLAAVARCAAVR